MPNERVRQLFFGGSFYPPHSAHSEMLKQSLRRDPLAIVHIVPTHQNPLKESPGSPLELIQAWIEDLADELSYQQFSRCQLELCELTAASTNNYTVDTLRSLQNIGDEWTLLLGSDSALSFARWKDPAALISLLKEIWIVPRADRDKAYDEDVLQKEVVDLFTQFGAQKKIIFLEKVPDISSSELRNEALSQLAPKFLSPRVRETWKKILKVNHSS